MPYFNTTHEFQTHIDKITKNEGDDKYLDIDAVDVQLADDFKVTIPHNFGDRLSTKDCTSKEYEQQLRTWLKETVVAPAKSNKILEILMGCLMALESNWCQMNEFKKILTVVEAKPEARQDRSIFCEFKALENMAKGNHTAAEFFINQMKEALEEACGKVFEAGADGTENTIIRTEVSSQGTVDRDAGKLNTQSYIEIMNYMRDKMQYADDLLNRMNEGWMLGADGMCFYDRQHYLHSVMLTIYSKDITKVLKEVKEDKGLYDNIKMEWIAMMDKQVKSLRTEGRETTEEEKAKFFEDALPGILANFLEQNIYDEVPKYVTFNKDFRDYILEGRGWDKFLPFACNMYDKIGELNFQATYFDHAKYRTMMVNAINDVKWECPWSLDDTGLEVIEVTD